MNAQQLDDRLKALGIELIPPASPMANFVPATLSAGVLYVSGQIPLHEGRPLFTGRVGSEVSVDQGRAAAHQCALAILAVLRAQLRDRWALRATLQIQGFVNAAAEFTQHPAVINGASDLLVEVLGDAGRHSRFAVGVSSLPLGVPVEVAAVFQLA